MHTDAGVVSEARRRSSDVVGSMMVLTSVTLLAGKPPRLACSRTAASFSAMYTQ